MVKKEVLNKETMVSDRVGAGWCSNLKKKARIFKANFQQGYAIPLFYDWYKTILLLLLLFTDTLGLINIIVETFECCMFWPFSSVFSRWKPAVNFIQSSFWKLEALMAEML